MRLSELQSRLNELNDLGFVPSERRGSTGVGYTLERCLGLTENNLPIPDIGGRVEVKATRRGTSNLITLFTLNRRAWQMPLRDVINEFGYVDDRGRHALYSTVSATNVNRQGLQLAVDPNAQSVEILHVPSGTKIAIWDMYHVVGKFMAKFERMLFVRADSRKIKGHPEEFHYVEATLLSDPGSVSFRDGFLEGDAVIDIRVHLQDSGAARNHGTAFRIPEQNLPRLFARRVRLV